MPRDRRSSVVRKWLTRRKAARNITNTWQLRRRQLACLQLLAAWRLRKARERDLAVTTWCVKNTCGRWRAICRVALVNWTAFAFRK
ncbi:hypothetical protein ACNKHO_08980 [Shigella flexneri]